MAALFFFMREGRRPSRTVAPPRAPHLPVAHGGDVHRVPPCAAAANCSRRGASLSSPALVAPSSLLFCASRVDARRWRPPVGCTSGTPPIFGQQPPFKKIARYNLRGKSSHGSAPIITAIFCGRRQLADRCGFFVVAWCRSSRDGCAPIASAQALALAPPLYHSRLATAIGACRRSDGFIRLRLGRLRARRMMVPVPSAQAASGWPTLRARPPLGGIMRTQYVV